MIFAIDIGNTTTAIGGFSRDGKLETSLKLATAEDSHEKLARELGKLRGTKGKVFSASVVPGRNSFWREVAQEFLGGDIEFLDANSPWSFHVDVEAPERVGVDRLANLQAAFEIGKTAVVVDAGTATKVDFLEFANGQSFFRGGIIAPGVGIGQEALTEKTAQLPSVDLSGDAPLVGRNTEQAIRSGIVNGFAGMVDGLVARIFQERKLPNYTPVIATGGFSPLLKARVTRITHFEPNLTLEGIYGVARRF